MIATENEYICRRGLGPRLGLRGCSLKYATLGIVGSVIKGKVAEAVKKTRFMLFNPRRGKSARGLCMTAGEVAMVIIVA